jgi:glycosyltransferase involved in cell wall biosynthesis
LTALAAQDLGSSCVEVVVVIDGEGSTESLEALRLPYPLRVIRQPHQGLAAARNRGAAEARGEKLVFCDDDMDLNPGFLRAVDRTLDVADVALADIRIADRVPNTPVTREARRSEAEWARGRPAHQVSYDVIYFAATGIRRAVFEASGGVAEAFTAQGAYGNEDIELGYRLLQARAKVHYADGAVAWTDLRHDLPTLLRRAEQVGMNDVRLVRTHPELAQVLGNKLRRTGRHRLIGRAVLAAPWLVRFDAPLRWVMQRWVLPGPDGPIRVRLWLALRAARYWRGVASAGGKELALAAYRKTAMQHSAGQ